jgi:hypothetical protein
MISHVTDIYSSNHFSGQTLTLPVPGKWKTKTKKTDKNQTSQAVTETRTSSLPDKILHQCSHGDCYSTVTRWLPDGCESPHTIIYTLIYKIYNNISFHWHTFIQPYIWPNFDSANAREVKTKTKPRPKTKTKTDKSQIGQAVIEARTSSLPNKKWCQFSRGGGDPTVTRRVWTTSHNQIYPQW